MKKKNLIFFAILFITLLILPLIVFIIKFKSSNISDSISDWAAFGDYIGGLANIVISVTSLIVLSFLTYIVSKQSSIENRKTNILIRKLDAYEGLTAFFPELNQFFTEILKVLQMINKRFNEESPNLDEIKELKNDFSKKVQVFSNFYYFLYTFNVRYGHLFEFNFDKIEFTRAIKNAKLLNEHFISARDSFNFDENKLIPYEHKLTEELFNDLTVIINEFRSELK